MLSNLIFALKAILPLELTIVLGYFVRRSGLLSEGFFSACDKLVFYVLLPCSIFTSLYTIDPGRDLSMVFLLYLFAGTTLLFILGFLSGKLLISDKEHNLGVSAMTVFRANTAFIGIPLATAIGGPEGTAAMSVSLLIAVPFFNLYTIIAFNRSNACGGRISVRDQLVSTLKNPLIISCLLGLAALFVRKLLSLSGSGTVSFSLERNLPSVYSVIQSVGSTASALALINIGAQIRFDFSRRQKTGDIVFGCVWRMILAPVIFVGLAALLTVRGVVRFTSGQMAAILAHFAGPASVTAASLTQEMGGNTNLCRQYIFITNILLIFTLPVFITALISMGLI